MDQLPKTIVQTRVQERLEATGQKAAPLSKKLGQSDSFIRDIIRGKAKSPAADAFELLAEALETTSEYLLGKTDNPTRDETAPAIRTVPIVGYAGAGPDGSVLFAEGQGNYGEADAPPGAAETSEALEVRGESMLGIANDGWLIFYEERIAPDPEHIGEPCVCWLANGKVLVKIPQPGTSPGLFHLESQNARTMRDQVVETMALVTDIKTRAAARRFIRKHPNIQIEDMVVEP